MPLEGHTDRQDHKGKASGGRRIHTDKVAALEVEAVQLVARLLRIHDVFIDNESSALCVACNALADLAAEDISTSRPTAYHRCHVPNRPVLSEELEELLWSYVVAAVGLSVRDVVNCGARFTSASYEP